MQTPKSIKICMLIQSLETGGAERQFSLIASQLKSDGVDITVGIFSDSHTEFSKLLEKESIPIYRFANKGILGRFITVFSLLSFIHRTKPDVIYGFMATANIFATLCRIVRWKCMIVWGIRSSDYDLKNQNFRVRLILSLEKYLSRFPNLIIFNSLAGKYNFAHLNNMAPRAIVQNGIDTDQFKKNKEKRLYFRRKYSYSDDDIIIGFIGRADRLKNIELFLNVAKHIKEHSSKKVKFFIAGPMKEDDAYYNELIIMSKKLKIDSLLTWTPILPNIEIVYNGIDIFCLTSTSEGFPNTLGEAMACETACIASAVGDVETMSHGAFPVVPVEKTDTYKKYLLDLIEGKHPISKPQLRNIVLNNFDLKTLGKRTLKALGYENYK